MCSQKSRAFPLNPLIGFSASCSLAWVGSLGLLVGAASSLRLATRQTAPASERSRPTRSEERAKRRRMAWP